MLQHSHTHCEKCPQCDGKVWKRFLESPIHNIFKDFMCLPFCCFLPSGFLINFDVSTKTMNLSLQLAGEDAIVRLCEMVDFHGKLLLLDGSIR